MLRSTSDGSEQVSFILAVVLLVISSVERSFLTFQRYGYECLFLFVYVCVFMHQYVCACVFMHQYVCACVFMHQYVCACVFMHQYVCVRVCVIIIYNCVCTINPLKFVCKT